MAKVLMQSTILRKINKKNSMNFKIKLDIKPMSVNAAWKGRRFKTVEYKRYEKAVLLMLPKISDPLIGNFGMNILYGFSSNASDIDNPTKLILDILQKKYGFNDKNIFELNLKKVITEKKKEFILLDFFKIAD